MGIAVHRNDRKPVGRGCQACRAHDEGREIVVLSQKSFERNDKTDRASTTVRGDERETVEKGRESS